MIINLDEYDINEITTLYNHNYNCCSISWCRT